MATISPQVVSDAAEAILKRVAEQAPRVNGGEQLKYLAEAVALIARNTNNSEGKSNGSVTVL